MLCFSWECHDNKIPKLANFTVRTFVVVVVVVVVVSEATTVGTSVLTVRFFCLQSV